MAWRPAEAAKEKLTQMEEDQKGKDAGDEEGISFFAVIKNLKWKDDLDLVERTPQELVKKARRALENKDYPSVEAYAGFCLQRYGASAERQQLSWDKNADDLATPYSNYLVQYGDLSAVGEALFILGESFRKQERFPEAKAVYQEIIDHYSHSLTWR